MSALLSQFAGLLWIQKRLPPSIIEPSKDANVPDGSLKGNGMIELRISPPGASMSLNSPGLSGSSSFRMRIPVL